MHFKSPLFSVLFFKWVLRSRHDPRWEKGAYRYHKHGENMTGHTLDANKRQVWNRAIADTSKQLAQPLSVGESLSRYHTESIWNSACLPCVFSYPIICWDPWYTPMLNMYTLMSDELEQCWPAKPKGWKHQDKTRDQEWNYWRTATMNGEASFQNFMEKFQPDKPVKAKVLTMRSHCWCPLCVCRLIRQIHVNAEMEKVWSDAQFVFTLCVVRCTGHTMVMCPVYLMCT